MVSLGHYCKLSIICEKLLLRYHSRNPGLNHHTETVRAGIYNQGFIPSVLILIIADQILNESLCCSHAQIQLIFM